MNITNIAARWWLMLKASVAITLKRNQVAIDAYRQILAMRPDDKDARAVIGNLYAEAGDLESAVQQFKRLVEIDSNQPDAWFNLGFLHDKRNELAAAERCFRKAVELRPALDRAWYGLGLVLVRDGRLEEAIGAFERSVKLQPHSPYGYYQLGMTHHHLGQSAAAWQVHRQLLEFEPKFAATLKRDIEQTVPQAASRISPDSSPKKEEATAETAE
jgi:tetratricopeptide (TPR) repeat protein